MDAQMEGSGWEEDEGWWEDGNERAVLFEIAKFNVCFGMGSSKQFLSISCLSTSKPGTSISLSSPCKNIFFQGAVNWSE